MRSGKREALPVHRVKIAKGAIDDAQSQFQVRVLLVMPRAHDGYRLEMASNIAFSESSPMRLRWMARWRRALALSHALFLGLGTTTGRPLDRSKYSSTVS